jgi:hypothetical protein
MTLLPSNDLTLLFNESQRGNPLRISKSIEPKLQTSKTNAISEKSEML